MHLWSTFSFVDCDRHRSEPDRNLDRFQGRFQALTAVAPAVKCGLSEPHAEDRLPPVLGFGGPVRMGRTSSLHSRPLQCTCARSAWEPVASTR